MSSARPLRPAPFPNAIKRLRERAGSITVQQLAEASGCSASALSHFENHDRPPSLAIAAAILETLRAEGLHVQFEELLDSDWHATLRLAIAKRRRKSTEDTTAARPV